MKKLLIAAMSILIITAFSACGSSTSPEETTAETTAEAAAEITEAETSAETESETTTEAETTTETETETEAASTNVFRGNGYTLSIDSETWMDASEYISLVAQWAENTDSAQDIDLTAEDMENASDAMFYHTGISGTNFNVVITEVGNVGVLDKEMLEMLGEAVKTQYSNMTGFIFESYEIVKVNGYDSLKINMSTDAAVFGAELKMTAYMFYNGTKQYVITYTAGVESYDSGFADFETVLDSFTFTE